MVTFFDLKNALGSVPHQLIFDMLQAVKSAIKNSGIDKTWKFEKVVKFYVPTCPFSQAWSHLYSVTCIIYIAHSWPQFISKKVMKVWKSSQFYMHANTSNYILYWQFWNFDTLYSLARARAHFDLTKFSKSLKEEGEKPQMPLVESAIVKYCIENT